MAAQLDYAPLARAASLFGIQGVGFMLALGSSFAELHLLLPGGLQPASRRQAAVYSALLFLVLCYSAGAAPSQELWCSALVPCLLRVTLEVACYHAVHACSGGEHADVSLQVACTLEQRSPAPTRSVRLAESRIPATAAQ